MKIHDLACPKPHISSSNINVFFMLFQDPLLDLIFLEFLVTWCQSALFWEPLGVQLGTKIAPKSAKWQPKARKIIFRAALAMLLEPICFQSSCRSAPGHHFFRFGMDFSKCLTDFDIILVQIPMHFWRQICKPLKPYATTILATQPEYNYPQRR